MPFIDDEHLHKCMLRTYQEHDHPRASRTGHNDRNCKPSDQRFAEYELVLLVIGDDTNPSCFHSHCAFCMPSLSDHNNCSIVFSEGTPAFNAFRV